MSAPAPGKNVRQATPLNVSERAKAPTANKPAQNKPITTFTTAVASPEVQKTVAYSAPNPMNAPTPAKGYEMPNSVYRNLLAIYGTTPMYSPEPTPKRRRASRRKMRKTRRSRRRN